MRFPRQLPPRPNPRRVSQRAGGIGDVQRDEVGAGTAVEFVLSEAGRSTPNNASTPDNAWLLGNVHEGWGELLEETPSPHCPVLGTGVLAFRLGQQPSKHGGSLPVGGDVDGLDSGRARRLLAEMDGHGDSGEAWKIVAAAYPSKFSVRRGAVAEMCRRAAGVA